ncbi:hypothetical protein C8R41DRAFT_868600 [Lentinula lateritia]|uniref:Uncharacterized protein n=1 Tax=Lentinula lateritia TaxID=40482 RepID=A0ABQ8VAW3_9AGAR|nr:hypothetical protein C8R41DRAFT_868600 [Lentinula lateritia]
MRWKEKFFFLLIAWNQRQFEQIGYFNQKRVIAEAQKDRLAQANTQAENSKLTVMMVVVNILLYSPPKNAHSTCGGRRTFRTVDTALFTFHLESGNSIVLAVTLDDMWDTGSRISFFKEAYHLIRNCTLMISSRSRTFYGGSGYVLLSLRDEIHKFWCWE